MVNFSKKNTPVFYLENPFFVSKKVFGNNFLYEGAAIFEKILKCATKHASGGNASEERGLRDR
jgi:hypothetical protein